MTRRGRPLTFRGWLRRYEREGSLLGDFADDVARDRGFPKENDRGAISFHLARLGAPYVVRQAFSAAWSAYEREVRDVMPAWVVANGNEIREGDEDGRLIAEMGSETNEREGELVAAAPELLTVVKDFAARVERIGAEAFRLRGEPMPEWDAKLARTREVLRRAGG